MFSIANNKYKCTLEVDPQGAFTCPKSGISGVWSELTEAQCKTMISKGNDCIVANIEPKKDSENNKNQNNK